MYYIVYPAFDRIIYSVAGFPLMSENAPYAVPSMLAAKAAKYRRM